MKSSFLSRFTPSLMSPEALEAIFVQRQELAQKLVDSICDSVRNQSKTPMHHRTLLIGNRGMGKTHLVSLVYYRISTIEDLQERLLIGWLREEEWGVGSFLDLLLRIFRSLWEGEQASETFKNLSSPPSVTYGVHTSCQITTSPSNYPTLTLPLQRGGNDISNFSPSQGGIKGGNSAVSGEIQTCVYTAASVTGKGVGGLGLKSRVEDLYKLSAEEAEKEAISLLQEVMGKKTLLLLVENLDDLFNGLGKEGQNKFHSFLQENNCVVLATSTTRFKAVNQKTSAFYNFFDIKDLEDFSAAEATQLLVNIAKLEGKTDLESYIRTATGKSRIRAVHHLAGGNPRLYVILSEFLTRQSLDDLVEPFMRMLDDLTPYYQARMHSLSSQQRKIIEFLTDFRHAISVKEIAQRCFMTQQTASSQLKDLRDKGYMRVESIGREAFYELREPMMRFCLEVKKQRGEPIRLFVDFLRCWYTREELQQRLGMEVRSPSDSYPAGSKSNGVSHFLFEDEMGLEMEELHPNSLFTKEREQEGGIFYSIQPLPEDAVIEREYIMKALEEMDREEEDNPRFIAYRKEFDDFWEKEDYAGALEYAKKLVENRGNSQDWVLQGRCLNRLKNYQEALDCFDRAIEIKPDYELPWNNRGLALRNLGRNEEAIESFDKAIAIKPDDELPWFNRGLALRNLGRYEEAIESYDNAIAIKPDYEYAWNNRGIPLGNLGRYEEAIESYDNVIAIKPDYEYAWFNRGIALGNLGRYEEAIKSYDNAIAIKPDYELAWNNRGNALRDLGRNEEAIESFDKAIAIKPDDELAWNNRGNALRNLGRNEEAIESFDKAIAIKPDDELAWNNRGNALRDLGRNEEAIESYDNAIAIKPDYESAWILRGYALRDLGRNEEAIESFDKAIAIKPDYESAWFNRGYTLGKLKRYKEAIESYDNAIAIKPDYELAWIVRGIALRNLGKNEEAIESYDNAIAIKPDYELAWKNRGSSLNDLKRYEEALESFDKAIEINPDSQSAWVGKSWTLIHLAQYEKALEYCNKAISLDEKEHYSFANRAIALAGLNRWQESLISFEDALKKLDEGKQASPEDTELILRILFTNTPQSSIWKNHIQSIIQLFHQYKSLSLLSQGLVRNIPTLMPEMVSDKAVQTWLELWQELASDYQEFKIALQLLNTAVRYRQNKGDRRILLELPIEERKLLEDILS